MFVKDVCFVNLFRSILPVVGLLTECDVLIACRQHNDKHWCNFTLKSGGDQWLRRDLVSGGTTIGAPKARASSAKGAEWGGVWGRVSAPQPTRESGGRRELPQRGPGRSPGRYRIFCIF